IEVPKLPIPSGVVDLAPLRPDEKPGHQQSLAGFSTEAYALAHWHNQRRRTGICVAGNSRRVTEALQIRSLVQLEGVMQHEVRWRQYHPDRYAYLWSGST